MDEPWFWAIIAAGGSEVPFPEHNLARRHPGRAGGPRTQARPASGSRRTRKRRNRCAVSGTASPLPCRHLPRSLRKLSRTAAGGSGAMGADASVQTSVRCARRRRISGRASPRTDCFWGREAGAGKLFSVKRIGPGLPVRNGCARGPRSADVAGRGSSRGRGGAGGAGRGGERPSSAAGPAQWTSNDGQP